MGTDDLNEDAEFVRNLARRRASNIDIADDLAQEAMVAMLSTALRDEKARRTWFYKVIRNLFIYHLRSRKRLVAREKKAPLLKETCTPLEIMIRNEERINLMAAVAELREPYHTAITLRYLENHSPRKIAQQLDLPVTTVKSHLRRGIELMRSHLEEQIKDKPRR